jgi:hypothetical protein
MPSGPRPSARIIRSCQLCGEAKSSPEIWPMRTRFFARNATEHLDIITVGRESAEACPKVLRPNV